MKPVMQYAALLAALPLAAAYAAGPFDGIFWPYDDSERSECTSVHAGDPGGPNVMVIRNNELIGLEWACQLTEPVRVNGMNAVLYNGICAVEGTEYTERLMLMKSDHGVYLIQDGYALDLIRCN